MSPTPDLLARESRERARAKSFDQGHVFAHWDSLDEPQRERLLQQLEAVDFELMADLAAKVAAEGAAAAAPTLTPPELFPLERTPAQEERAKAARERGARELAGGAVGFMIVAGGQGSRLGYDGPKGCFELGPLTDRTLFAYHAARIRAAGARYGFEPVWYVMTSPMNAEPTESFFREHDHFGLGAKNVFFFSQAMLPAMDLHGRLLLAGPDQLFLAPNGHGGSLAALADSGALADMRRRGITTLSYFQVDNPLARPADPLFIGLHLEVAAGMSSKVVSKRDAGEKVGVLGLVDGKLGCIEYSDLSAELRDARDETGQLAFRAGNIALHLLDVAFIEELAGGGKLQLPWHIAKKQVSVLAPDGAFVDVEGVKFETFVFDALALSPASVTLEVDRALEFSPVKNKTGQDSADSCRADLTAVFRGMLAAAGATGFEGGLEIDPLFAEDAAELAARLAPGEQATEVAGGHVFELPSSLR